MRAFLSTERAGARPTADRCRIFAVGPAGDPIQGALWDRHAAAEARAILAETEPTGLNAFCYHSLTRGQTHNGIALADLALAESLAAFVEGD